MFKGSLNVDRNQKLKSYQTSEIVQYLSISQCKETKEHYQENIKYLFNFLRKVNNDGIDHGRNRINLIAVSLLI